jgi:histone H3/H4
MAGGKKELDMVLVQSKVRDAIREKDLRTSDDFITALNEHVHHALEQAISRCKENGRQTLRAQDV